MGKKKEKEEKKKGGEGEKATFGVFVFWGGGVENRYVIVNLKYY